MGGRSLSCRSRCCVRPDSIDVTSDVTDVESILVTYEKFSSSPFIVFCGGWTDTYGRGFLPQVQSTRRLNARVDGRLPIRPVTGFRRCDLVMIDRSNVPVFSIIQTSDYCTWFPVIGICNELPIPTADQPLRISRIPAGIASQSCYVSSIHRLKPSWTIAKFHARFPDQATASLKFNGSHPQ
jgi:hypothetical protein